MKTYKSKKKCLFRYIFLFGEVTLVTSAYLDGLLTPEVRLVASIEALKAYNNLKKV